MRWSQVRVRRLPGLDPHRRDTLTFASDGATVVVGPNASGKSSLVRAIRSVLDPSFLRDADVDVDVTLDWDGAAWTGRRLGSKITWTRDGHPHSAPPLPSPRFFDFYALDLESLGTLDASSDTEMLERIRRELAGGYDLRAVAASAPFDVTPSRMRSERTRASDAHDAWMAATADAARLAHDERELARWEANLAAAREAERNARVVEALTSLATAATEARDATAHLASFPKGMTAVHEGTLATLAQSLDAWRDGRAEADRCTRNAGAAEDDAAALDLADVTPDEAAWDAVLEQIALCDDAFRTSTHARVEAAAHEEVLARTVRDLGPPDASTHVDLSPGTAASVDERLDTWREATSRVQAAREAVQIAEEAADALRAGLGDADLVELRRRHDALSSWLRQVEDVPDDVPPRTSSSDALAVILGLTSAAASAWLAGSLDELPGRAVAAALSAAAALLAVLPWIGGRRTRSRDADRRSARHAIERAGVGADGPATWTVDEVRAARDRTEARMEATRRLADLERDAASAAARGAAAERAVDAAAEDLRDVARQVGFDPLRLGAGLQRWIRLLERRDDAADAASRACARRDASQEHLTAQRDEATSLLRACGSIVPADVASCVHDVTVGTFETRLRAHVSAIRTRLRQRRASLEAADGWRRRAAEARRNAARAEADIRDLARATAFPGCDEGTTVDATFVADLEAHVRRQVDLLDAFTDATTSDRRARTAVEVARAAVTAALDEAGDAGKALVTLGPSGPESIASAEALPAILDELRARADQVDDWQRTITAHRTRVEDARKHEKVGEASAAWHAAQAELDRKRNEALHAAAGTFLLATVEEEHERTAKPEVLREAERTFARFTRHAFDLRFGDGTFTAWDAVLAAPRSLGELSSATRAHATLAVRVAFARSIERHTAPMPFLLDEALTTSDPERFRAVAEALSDVVRDDRRQLLYLSARMDDAEAWQHAATVPCTVIAWPPDTPAPAPAVTARALRLPERTPLPAPGDDAAAYGARLDVPPVDPWRDADAVHLFHLLRDDLHGLHALLAARITTSGVARSWLDALQNRVQVAASLGVDVDLLDTLARRIDGARAWTRAWRIGRARPVDRLGLAASPLGSSKFLDDAVAIVEDAHGDARALVDAIDAKRLPGFRSDVRDRVVAWLEERGHLVDRPPLTPEQRVAHLVAESSAAHGRSPTDDVQAWWWLDDTLRAGIESAATRAREHP